MSISEEPLLVYDGTDGPRTFRLAGEPIQIGRDAKSDLTLSDRSLSTRHCRIEPTATGYKVVDLGSRNGTYVNDTLVEQRELYDGDLIKVGRRTMRFVESGEAETLYAQVAMLTGRVHRRFGLDGVRTAAARFSTTASQLGVQGLLVDSEEIRAAQKMQNVARAMVERRKPQGIFDEIVDTLIEFTRAERGFFILHPPSARAGKSGKAKSKRKSKARKGRKKAARNGKRDERKVVAARNFDREGVRDALAKISSSIDRDAFERGDPIIVTDAALDERYNENESIVDMQLRSILAVPVQGPDGPVGTIYLDNRFERGLFLDRQLPLIRTFADQAAVALRNAELHTENEKRLKELTMAKAEVEELNRILSDRVAQTSAELMEVREQVMRDLDAAPLKYSYANIIGASKPMRDVFHLLDRVTDSDVPVLIQGESGTGKELVARAIHFNGARKTAPFISENCAAIPETLLESELFGYKKGSFTGATADKKGLFEAANGGTLFLDEIGDMPMNMQKKLLRVLQEREVRRVGGSRAVAINVRILAASNQDLRRLCDEGKFREDLFYRLNVITVNLPPLRERREDLPLLIEHFLGEISETTGRAPRTVSEEAMSALQAYHWPGNVRELRNEVMRAAALSDRVIVPLILSPQIRGGTDDRAAVADLGKKTLKEMVKEVTDELESKVIQEALRRSRGRKAQAARLLGVSRPTLDAKIDLHGLVVKRE